MQVPSRWVVFVPLNLLNCDYLLCTRDLDLLLSKCTSNDLNFFILLSKCSNQFCSTAIILDVNRSASIVKGSAMIDRNCISEHDQCPLLRTSNIPLKDSILWVLFDWDMLSLLRFGVPIGFPYNDIPMNVTPYNCCYRGEISKLSSKNEDFLYRCLGSSLSVLVDNFVSGFQNYSTFASQIVDESLVETKSLKKIQILKVGFLKKTEQLIKLSYTLSLIKCHMESDHVAIDNTSMRQFPTNKAIRKYAPATPDPILVLISSIQMLILFVCIVNMPVTILCTNQTRPSLHQSDSRRCSTYSHFPKHWNYITDNMFKELNCKNIGAVENILAALDSDGNTTWKTPITLSLSTLRYLSNITTICWIDSVNQFVEFFTCELSHLLMWLETGKPAGLKINRPLARMMGQFFLYHIFAWRSYVIMMIYLVSWCVYLLQQLTEVNSLDEYFYANFFTSICLMFGTIYLVVTKHAYEVSMGNIFVGYLSAILRLMFAITGCLILDLLNLTTLPLSSFYMYASRILRLQLITIAAAWRLCRSGCKWNPLRNRVDTVPDMYNDVNQLKIPLLQCESSGKKDTKVTSLPLVGDNGQGMYLDRLLVATLLGLAIGLCLLSTTLAFYVLFASIQFIIIMQKNMIKFVIEFVLRLPISDIFKWLTNTNSYRNKLIMEPVLSSTDRACLRLRLVRQDFTDVIKWKSPKYQHLFQWDSSLSEIFTLSSSQSP